MIIAKPPIIQLVETNFGSLLLLFKLVPSCKGTTAPLVTSANCESKMSIRWHPTTEALPFHPVPSHYQLHLLFFVLRQDHLFRITVTILARHQDIWKTALSTLRAADTELDTINIPMASSLTVHALPHLFIKFIPLTSFERWQNRFLKYNFNLQPG